MWIFLIITVLLFIYVPMLSSYINNQKKLAEMQARKDRIYQKYGRTETAERIIKKIVWVGETSEQLSDSFGPPLDIDERVLKIKKREIWKYYQKSVNRYGFKITVENGIVIGWDEKM